MKRKAKQFIDWSLTFTKKIVLICTAVWAMIMVYSAVMILVAILTIGDFSYLDTFITDTGETFRLIVGVNIVSKTVENVFKYNEGGIFGQKVKIESDGDPCDP